MHGHLLHSQMQMQIKDLDKSWFDSRRTNNGSMINWIWKAFLVAKCVAGKYLGEAPLQCMTITYMFLKSSISILGSNADFFFSAFICHTIFIGMGMCHQWWLENQQVCVRSILQSVHLGISTCAVSTAPTKVCLQLLASSSLYKPTVAVLYRCTSQAKCSLPLELPREPSLPPTGQKRDQSPVAPGGPEGCGGKEKKKEGESL